jgi:hypothetical protein
LHSCIISNKQTNKKKQKRKNSSVRGCSGIGTKKQKNKLIFFVIHEHYTIISPSLLKKGLQMGQVASRRNHHNIGDVKRKRGKGVKKYPLEIWRQIKDAEIVQLREKAVETEQEFERCKRKISCQSFLLKEIFQDTLKEQRENYNKEIAELRKEIAELKKEIQKKN